MNARLMNRRTFAGALLIIAIQGSGCLSHRSGTNITAPVQANPQPKILTDPSERINEANLRLVQFTERSQQLPGDSEAAYRALVRDTFTDLSTIIPALEGPDAGPAFRQQMRIIESTSGELSALPAQLSSEPTIAAGLRAANNALSEINTEQFSNRSEILDALNLLGSQIDQLDTRHDSDYRNTVARAVQSMGSVMQKMNRTLMYRLKSSTQASNPRSSIVQTQPAATSPSGEK